MSSIWQESLYKRLRELDLTLFAYVPDGGHKHLINRASEDDAVVAVPLTNEAEGVPMLAGHALGGGRGVLLMQSSGVGNCINQLSLVRTGRFPFFTIVTMRGEFGEQNPWQLPMGQAVRPCLEAMGVVCIDVERHDEVLTAATAAADMAYRSDVAVGMLLTQKLLGAKRF